MQSFHYQTLREYFSVKNDWLMYGFLLYLYASTITWYNQSLDIQANEKSTHFYGFLCIAIYSGMPDAMV